MKTVMWVGVGVGFCVLATFLFELIGKLIRG